MPREPKATDDDRTARGPGRNKLGNLQTLAVMGYNPGDANPGLDRLARRHRLLTGFPKKPYLIVEPRVPLTISDIDYSHDELVSRWNELSAIPIHESRPFWASLQRPISPTYEVLFEPYIRRTGGVAQAG